MASFLLGQTVRIVPATVEDDAGPADPATLSLTITLPDDTTVAAVIGDFTRVSAGLYRYDYVPSLAGRYSWRVVSTVPATADEGVFDVESAGGHAADPVTLDDAKAELNLTSTADDGELQRMLNAAVVQIGHIVGPLSVETVVEQHAYPGGTIVPRKRPVVSLTSVAMQWDCGIAPANGGSWTLVGDVLYWRPDAFGCYRAQAWLATVTYQAGWSPLPEDLRMAVLELVRWLWSTQSGSRIRQNVQQPPMRGDGGPVAFALLPDRVKELVAPYRYGARGIG